MASFVVANPVRSASSSVEAKAAGRSPAELGYSVEHWTVQEGLPGRIITSLAQTPDGALWCGSFDGLARFDGTRFTRFDPERFPALRDIRILEMRCDQVGRLWLEDIDGKLVLYEAGRFQRLQEQHGIPANQAGRLSETESEDFWVRGRTDDRFYCYHAGSFKPADHPPVPSSSIDRFVAGAKGLRWAIHERERTLVEFLGSKTEVHRLPGPDGKSIVLAGRFFRLLDGRWGVTSSYGIYALTGSDWELLYTPTRSIAKTIGNLALDGLQDWGGNFWATVYEEGLVLTGPNLPTTPVALPHLNPRPFLRTMILGREGSIWIGGNDGLYRLCPYPFRPQPPNAEAHNESAVAFMETGPGSIWILYRDGWARQTEAGWTFHRHPNPEAFFWSGCALHDDSAVLAWSTAPDTAKGCHLEKVTPDGNMQSLGDVEGIVRVLLQTRSGQLWVGTEAGLWRWDGNRFVAEQLPQHPGGFSVHGLAEDKKGRMLAGVYGSGLWALEPSGNWRKLTTSSDEASTQLWGVTVDTEGSAWVATDAGLARWLDGKWSLYGSMQGELPRLVRSVTCDHEHGLWISSQSGVVRVNLSALDSSTAGTDASLGSDWFDHSDGLPSVSCSDEQGALYTAADGRVWVGTLNGAAVMDPLDWQRRRHRIPPPSVSIDAILTDDRSVSVPTTTSGAVGASVRPGAQRVEFRYSVVDLTPNRKARLRYRLEGFDKDWTEAGDQRAAVYHHVPPGEYRFQVMAANKYGLGTAEAVSAAVLVQPHYWQTLWFRIGASLTGLGVIWLSRVLTLRRLHRERARREQFSLGLLQSQEAERKRIAQELHDSLGQDLILIRNAAKLTLRKFAPSPGVGEQLGEMAELASHALNNARAITSNLRPPELDRLGLTAALETMVEKHAEHSDIRLTATIENVDDLWSADQEIHVYRIVQESLNNAVKHALPTQIELAVTMQAGEVEIRLKDDGCGFDPEQLATPRAGIGLAGLRERLRILGGVMELTSSRGEGTTFSCQIPVTVHEKKRNYQNPAR